MSLELLFGLAIALFLVAWALWLFAVTSGFRLGMIGAPILVVVLAAAVVILNGERGDQQSEDYRERIEQFIAEVRSAQEATYEAEGEYADELPELDEQLLTIDGGVLQEEKTLEPTLTTSESGYTVTGVIEGESYSLEVERTGSGQAQETRTCTAAPDAGCVDGQWQ